MKLRILFVLATVFTSHLLSAQIIDSLPFFRLPERIGAFEQVTGPLSPAQENEISTAMIRMANNFQPSQSRQQRRRLRGRITAILTEEQQSRLRGSENEGRTAMGDLLRDFPPRPREDR